MTPLSITHAGGERTLASYRVPSVEQRYASFPDLHRGSGDIVMYGDHNALPGPFTVEAWMEAYGGLPAAMGFAMHVVQECETATRVNTHWGALPVDGLLAYRVRADGRAVRLTLEFAPTQAAPLEGVTADSTVITADSTVITADQTVLA